MLIDSYDFGRIVIQGRSYSSDVIIAGDRVYGDWWRREGHKVSLEDIRETVERENPEVLVVGTGYNGLVKVLPETERFLSSKGVKLVAEKTEKACEVFNQLTKSKRVVAALHLTC